MGQENFSAMRDNAHPINIPQEVPLFRRLSSSFLKAIKMSTKESDQELEDSTKYELVQERHMPSEFRESHIHEGYRPIGLSVFQCVRSLFYIHNETVNVWTHLIPGIIYICYLVAALRTHESHSSRLEKKLDAVDQVAGVCPFCIFLFSAAMVALTSAAAHTFQVVSTFARHICFLSDYAMLSFYGHCLGILFFAHSYWPADSTINQFFLPLSAVVSIISTFLTGATRMLPQAVKTRQFFRAMIFAAPTFLNTLPILHRFLMCSQGLERAKERGFDYEGACQGTAAFYWNLHFMMLALSGFFYVSHIPECWWPGVFDIYGNSHQFLHIFGILGTCCVIQAAKADKAHWGLDSWHGVGQRSGTLHQLPISLRMAYRTCAAVFLASILTVALFAWKMGSYEEEEICENSSLSSAKCSDETTSDLHED